MSEAHLCSSDGGIVLEVRGLPEAGRPAGFTNAVGTFVLGASLDKRSFDVGENIGAKLQIDLAEADKNIAQAEAESRRAMAVDTSSRGAASQDPDGLGNLPCRVAKCPDPDVTRLCR